MYTKTVSLKLVEFQNSFNQRQFCGYLHHHGVLCNWIYAFFHQILWAWKTRFPIRKILIITKDFNYLTFNFSLYALGKFRAERECWHL